MRGSRMPELPEVETVCRGMDRALRGLVINRAETHRDGLRAPFPPLLTQKIRGAKILGCRRRAKYIVVDLDNGQAMVIHLGMSGQIFLIPPGQPHERRKHDHLVMDFDDGSRLGFNDARWEKFSIGTNADRFSYPVSVMRITSSSRM